MLRAGHEPLFKWLRGKNCTVTVMSCDEVSYSRGVADAAAESGRLELLQKLKLAAQIYGLWSDTAAAAAARAGHMHVPRWLLEAAARDRRQWPVDEERLQACAAYGCDLEGLQVGGACRAKVGSLHERERERKPASVRRACVQNRGDAAERPLGFVCQRARSELPNSLVRQLRSPFVSRVRFF